MWSSLPGSSPMTACAPSAARNPKPDGASMTVRGPVHPAGVHRIRTMSAEPHSARSAPVLSFRSSVGGSPSTHLGHSTPRMLTPPSAQKGTT